MTEKQNKLLECVDARADELFAIGCDIFDHPEIGRQEFHAVETLTGYLEKQGFSIEHGVGGLETAFRAVWERGSGGPSIGFMMEYDALVGLGHACGHHLQGPTTIGAALARRDTCKENFKLVLYGTPDEERAGGKIDMVENGCFRDVDVMFSYHTAGSTGTSYTNKALTAVIVTFHGTPAHASGSPHLGRSALDAMMLAFHGMEIMREHVKDGSRIHYTILEGTGPSNVVPKLAKAHITLRANDRHYVDEMVQRTENVIRGACLMTDTTADIERRKSYWNFLPVPSLRKLGLDIAEELGAENLKRGETVGKASTDVGNVSWVVPDLHFYTYFCSAAGHTEELRNYGKTDNARRAMLSGSKILGCAALRLVEDPALLETIKQEHKEAVRKSEESVKR